MAVQVCRVTPQEVKSELDRGERVVLVDVRQPGSYESSPYEIPGAIRIPPDQVEEMYGSLPRDARIVTFCT